MDHMNANFYSISVVDYILTKNFSLEHSRQYLSQEFYYLYLRDPIADASRFQNLHGINPVHSSTGSTWRNKKSCIKLAWRPPYCKSLTRPIASPCTCKFEKCKQTRYCSFTGTARGQLLYQCMYLILAMCHVAYRFFSHPDLCLTSKAFAHNMFFHWVRQNTKHCPR